MAEIKSFRLRADQAEWLRVTAERTQLSQNRIIQALIDGAMADTPAISIDLAAGADA